MGMIVGINEQQQVGLELVVAVVLVPFDGGFLDGPVHALNLPVPPRMVGLGQAMPDAVFAATGSHRYMLN